MESVTPEACAQYEKRLKTGVLGMMWSVVIGVAWTAPAYSLAGSRAPRGSDRRAAGTSGR